MKNKFITLILLLILLVVLFKVLPFKCSLNNQATKTVKQPQASQVTKEVYPECIASFCPEYSEVNMVPTDRRGQTAIIIRTAMTQGAGKLVIVKNGGEKIFDSGVLPGISFKPADDGNGFILTYYSFYDENFNNERYDIRYVWIEDKFVKKQ